MAAKEREYLNSSFPCFCLINSQFGSSVCPSVCSVLCVVPITKAIKECDANCAVKKKCENPPVRLHICMWINCMKGSRIYNFWGCWSKDFYFFFVSLEVGQSFDPSFWQRISPHFTLRGCNNKHSEVTFRKLLNPPKGCTAERWFRKLLLATLSKERTEMWSFFFLSGRCCWPSWKWHLQDRGRRTLMLIIKRGRHSLLMLYLCVESFCWIGCKPKKLKEAKVFFWRGTHTVFKFNESYYICLNFIYRAGHLNTYSKECESFWIKGKFSPCVPPSWQVREYAAADKPRSLWGCDVQVRWKWIVAVERSESFS